MITLKNFIVKYVGFCQMLFCIYYYVTFVFKSLYLIYYIYYYFYRMLFFSNSGIALSNCSLFYLRENTGGVLHKSTDISKKPSQASQPCVVHL